MTDKLIARAADKKPFREIGEKLGIPFVVLETYNDNFRLFEERETFAKQIYLADDLRAVKRIDDQQLPWEEQDCFHLPVRMAKTKYRFTTDPNRRGVPESHLSPLREVRLSAQAGFVIVICGETMTMPGLPRVPSAEAIHLYHDGEIEGLF